MTSYSDYAVARLCRPGSIREEYPVLRGNEEVDSVIFCFLFASVFSAFFKH